MGYISVSGMCATSKVTPMTAQLHLIYLKYVFTLKGQRLNNNKEHESMNFTLG